jgi:hypothetical protein
MTAHSFAPLSLICPSSSFSFLSFDWRCSYREWMWRTFGYGATVTDVKVIRDKVTGEFISVMACAPSCRS